MPANEEEAREFARAFRRFLSWVQQEDQAISPVVALLRDHLTAAGLEQSVVSRQLPPFEHVNLQAALDAWMAAESRSVTVQGLAIPPHYGPIELQQLLHGEQRPRVRLSAPELVDLPSGLDRTLACLTRALLLVTDARGSYVLFVQGPDPHEQQVLSVEVAGLATREVQAVLRELDELRSKHNVYRGQLLELVPGPGGVQFRFVALPPTERDEVVLPEPVLRRAERHTVDVAAQRAALRAAGQHLKRGLLLHGPPGTGKTHTMRYLVQQLPGATVLLLSGRSLHLIGMLIQLARDLEPAVLVLEDVDLVAESRDFGHGSSPVLFELLDAMDGAASDADLLFLLTTNRADLLEPALAARPGRVDVAVEIGLPGAHSRRRLLELYSRGVPMELSETEVRDAVERTTGVTASFIKELVRRAVLEALESDGSQLRQVSGVHLARALDDLLDSSQSVTRALLGVSADQRAEPAVRPLTGHRRTGWAASPGDAYGRELYLSDEEGP